MTSKMTRAGMLAEAWLCWASPVCHEAKSKSMHWVMWNINNNVLPTPANIPWLRKFSISNSALSCEGMFWQLFSFDHNLTRLSEHKHKTMLMLEFSRSFTIHWHFFPYIILCALCFLLNGSTFYIPMVLFIFPLLGSFHSIHL